jgi:hypothetical protein
MKPVEAKLNPEINCNLPDIYNPAKGRMPSDDFVVSRNKDGSPLSLYGDSTWNWTPYNANNRTVIFSFKFWSSGELTQQREQLAGEIRWLMFILIYLRPDPGLSISSLRSYLGLLNFIARICELRNLSVYEFLADPALLNKSIEAKKAYALMTKALIHLLRYLGSDAVGFSVVDSKAIQNLKKVAANYALTLKQHAPIPTRLYSILLATLAQEFNKFERVADRMLGLLQVCASDPLMGRTYGIQSRSRKALGLGKQMRRPLFQDLLKKFDLGNYWTEKGYQRSLLGIETAITEAMVMCAFQIQAFTGMRKNEVDSLPFHCLEVVKRDKSDNLHYIVKGRTTKLNHGKIKQAQWVTSETGAKAIKLAQRISTAIYGALGQLPEDNKSPNNPYYLFISPSNLFRRSSVKLSPAYLMLERSSNLKHRLQSQMEIRDADLLELEQIDPHRAWRSEDAFQIGHPWRFKSHQLRRSLALYAQRSGLVTLPSLKRQLQHITQEMSLYYCRGSAFAASFIGNDSVDKPHFGKEWQATQPVSQFFSYVAHVLMTDEILFGGHPHWLKHRLSDGGGKVIFDRDATLIRFQKGELAYRETILGGCVKVGDCDKNPLDILHVGCLASHCKNLVGNKKKLERVVTAQVRLVDKLSKINPASTEYRFELSNLTTLKTVLVNLEEIGRN